MIITISIIIYLFLGHLFLKILDNYNVIDYDWDYDPIRWTFGIIFWIVIAFYHVILFIVMWINRNLIDTMLKNIIELIEWINLINKNKN